MTRILGSTDLKRLHRTWRRRAPSRLGLLLDSVATPVNVGSILRTAAAMRVDDVWLGGQTSGTDSPGVAKTAMGSERFVSLHRVADVADAIGAVREAGYRLVGVELADDGEPVHEADLAGDVCLAVGHEDRGLSSAVLTGADSLVYVPQLGRVGSLNVAVAAAIALYEARRQGWPPPEL